MILKRTVNPTVEPVAIDTARLHLRVDHTIENGVIDRLIKAAREYCEEFQGRALLSQTWRMKLDCFPDDSGCPIVLPRPPLLTVSSITYVDVNGVTQTWSSSNYTVDTDAEPGRVFPVYGVDWPGIRDDINAVTITYTAGYGTSAANVPSRTVQAMLLLIGHWWENREGVLVGTISKEVEFAVKSLLWTDRISVV